MKKYKSLIIFFLLFIYTYFILYMAIANNDYIWNYQFCSNVASNMLMYKDFNMVITPLYPTLLGIIMSIVGNNILIFTLLNTIIILGIYLIIYKQYSKVFIPSIILISYFIVPSYNFLCMLFLFLLFYLEDNKKNDYLIGLTLGLLFLTKSSFGLLTLASIMYIKDIKKCLKRFIGFIMPNLIFIIYFYFKDILFDYINYAFLGLFDFSNTSLTNIYGEIFTIILIIYLIYLYFKKKDIKIIYLILFQIMSYPLFNFRHLAYSIIPVIFYLLLNKKEFNNYLKYIMCILLICPILSSSIYYIVNDVSMGNNSLKYKLIDSKMINDSKIIKDNVKDLDKTYFIMYEAYYNKVLLDLKINKYDLLLNGNIGYDGENKVIDYFDSLDNTHYFLVYNKFEEGDASFKIYNHIISNYKLVKTFDKYKLYRKY